MPCCLIDAVSILRHVLVFSLLSDKVNGYFSTPKFDQSEVKHFHFTCVHTKMTYWILSLRQQRRRICTAKEVRAGM